MTPVEIPVPALSGEFEAKIVDPTGTPVNVIPRELDWKVEADWYMEGALAPTLDGTWYLRVTLESMGPGQDLTSAEVTRDYSADGIPSGTFPNERMSFTHEVTFAANSIPTGSTLSRAYRGTALLTFADNDGTPGPFAAVYDLGVIQIYNSPHLPD